MRCTRWVPRVAIVTLCACGGGSGALPSDRVWSSAHFDYRSRNGDGTTCPDVLGPLEEHFAILQAYLGVDRPAGSKITYYKFADQSDLGAHSGCPIGAGGCTIGSTVEAADGFDEHELIHAYLDPVGLPPPVLVEGVAVALSCQTRTLTSTRKPPFAADEIATLDPDLNGRLVYEAGAWLVGYLLDVFGPKPFLALYGSLPRDASSADLDAAFQRTFSQSLDQVWAAALADEQARSACVWECSRPPIALDGSTVDTTTTCGVSSLAHPFTLSSEATLAVTTTAADMTVGPCGRVTPPGRYSSGANGAVGLYHLPAAAYFLEHRSSPGTIAARGDAAGALSQDCARATDSTLLDQDNVFVTIKGTPAPWFLPLPPRMTPTLQVVTDAGSNEGAGLCATCDPSSCADASRSVGWMGGGVLTLTTDPSAPFSQFAFALQ